MFKRKTKKIQSEYESIATLEEVEIGNIKQTILIRGENIENPLMLFLHGGPGTAQIGFAPKFQKKLEKDFIVVNWDQRGAGLSYSKKLDLNTLTMEQIIQDTIELIHYLLKRFRQSKLYLVGHSWGSVIGVIVTKQIPQFIHSYIGIGQVVNMRKGEKISYEYTLEKASELKNSQAVRELHTLVYDPASLHDLTIQRKWLAQFGGSYVGIKMVNLILPNILFATEYTILDWFTHLKAARISLEKMWKPLLTIDFSETITKLDVPVYFFVGIQDFLTPAELTEEYYTFLKCPYKELIWFENSAHMLCFEEPDKFYQECVRIKEKSPLSWDVEYDEINS